MSFKLEGPVLEGALVRLEPLEHRHTAGLALAAEEDRGTYDFTWVPRAAEAGDYVDAQLARAATGRLAPYAQISLASGRVVGATSYWEPRSWRTDERLDAVEVGFTWLAGSAQGTGVNAEAKLLLFRHAFTQWGVPGGPEDGRPQQPLARRHRERGRPLRGRPAQLVPFLGAGRGRPPAGLRDLLRHGGGMAGLRAAVGGAGGAVPAGRRVSVPGTARHALAGLGAARWGTARGVRLSRPARGGPRSSCP